MPEFNTLNQSEAILSVLMWLHNQSQFVRYATMNDEDFACEVVSHFTLANHWDVPRDQSPAEIQYPTDAATDAFQSRAVIFCKQQDVLLDDEATPNQVN